MAFPKVNIDGKDRELFYGLDELELIEEFHNCSIGELAKKPISGMVTMLWAGLHRHSPELNRDDVKNLFETFLIKSPKKNEARNMVEEKIKQAMKESNVFSDSDEPVKKKESPVVSQNGSETPPDSTLTPNVPLESTVSA